MSSSPELTFVVPAYGQSPFLEECLNSLLEQHAPARILLITSTPSDFLDGIAQKFGLPLRVNQSGGLAADWSFAYAQAETRYVTLAHQDDLYVPDYSTRFLEAASRYPDNLIVFSDYSELGETGQRGINATMAVKRIINGICFARSKRLRQRWWKRALLGLGSPICCPSVMFHKTLIGDFAFAEDLSINVDWEAWLRLAERPGSFVFVNERLMLHRIHAASETTLGLKHNRRQVEDLRMFRQLWPSWLAGVISKMYAASYSSNSPRRT